jgi:hypothetical protein
MVWLCPVMIQNLQCSDQPVQRRLCTSEHQEISVQRHIHSVPSEHQSINRHTPVARTRGPGWRAPRGQRGRSHCRRPAGPAGGPAGGRSRAAAGPPAARPPVPRVRPRAREEAMAGPAGLPTTKSAVKTRPPCRAPPPRADGSRVAISARRLGYRTVARGRQPGSARARRPWPALRPQTTVTRGPVAKAR